MATAGFYLPGCWVFRKGPSWLRTWVAPLIMLGAIVVSIVAVPIATWLGVPSGRLWLVYSVLALVAGVASYLRESEAKLKELEKASVKVEYLAQVKRDHDEATGNLSALLRLLEARNARSITPTQLEERLNDLQGRLLLQIVAVMELARALGRGVVSANWVVRDPNNPDVFRVVRYDRNRVDRVAGRAHEIRQGLPGAAEAFLKGDVCLVADTQAEDTRAHFTDNRSYRTILSIPVRVRDGFVLGVVNVDGTIPRTFQVEDAYLISDAAYVIGLCETLKGKSS
jgi:hypothetical protein